MNTTNNPDATTLAIRLADTLTSGGQISDPAWREAFLKVSRHVFIPHFAVSEDTADGTRYRPDGCPMRVMWCDRRLLDHRRGLVVRETAPMTGAARSSC